MNSLSLKAAYLIAIFVFEQSVKLPAIALKRGTRIKDFAKDFLHLDNMFRNSDFPAYFLL